MCFALQPIGQLSISQKRSNKIRFENSDVTLLSVMDITTEISSMLVRIKVFNYF